MNILDSPNCYFELRNVCKVFNLSYNTIYNIIYKDRCVVIKDGTIIYYDKIYLTLSSFYYIIIKYLSIYNFKFNSIRCLLNNIGDIEAIGKYITRTYITTSNLHKYRNKIILMKCENIVSYVYVAYNSIEVKIGSSQNIVERLYSLEISKSSTYKLGALLYYDGALDAFRGEKLLHNIYCKLRIKGEWFINNGIIVEEIRKNNPDRLI